MKQLVENTARTNALDASDVDDRRRANAIENTFAHCFARDYHTQLIGGGREPLYQPGSPARLLYREDFPASALHEVAHWCVAGAARRKLEDFGYPYIAGPRTPDQQAMFFALELRAQSLEKRFAEAAGLDFLPSADNLQADLDAFGRAIEAHQPLLLGWLARPSGARAQRFIHGLRVTFGKTGDARAPGAPWADSRACVNDSRKQGEDVD